ncbi:hypothetical protein PC116_g31779 [Phytophthora cactorum]|nr:hypothetical protein PC116_g31779 [Phytophthora cactorum]
MCKIYVITYSCGCEEKRETPCAESPNTLGACSKGVHAVPEKNPGPCDKHT